MNVPDVRDLAILYCWMPWLIGSLDEPIGPWTDGR